MLRDAVARRLEAGEFTGATARLASRAWSRLSRQRIVRPLRVPDGARVITIGGATLGGSWKTPLAIACAKELGEAGLPVVLVGHAYGARPGRARFVEADDRPTIVGDEALACAGELAGVYGARVAVGRTRQEAFDLAFGHASHVVIDGALQLSPRRASLALLSVDARAPWGVAGACPPCGDLQAPIDALIGASDALVLVGGERKCPHFLPPGVSVRRVRAVLSGARHRGRLLRPRELAGLRLGLCTSIARPLRLLKTMADIGLYPSAWLSCGDHGAPTWRTVRAARTSGVDLWLCTAKCRAHIGAELAGRPVATLELVLKLDARLAAELRACPCLDPV